MRIIAIGFCMVLNMSIQGQSIQWEKSIGGSDDDRAYSIAKTDSGCFIICGRTYSNDGDIPGQIGLSTSQNVVVSKIDTGGNIKWVRIYGGTQHEEAHKIIHTYDGGYAFCGKTSSTDFDVIPGIHGGQWNFFNDAWFVKLNSNGDIEWQSCFGGTGEDFANDLIQLPDSGYLFVGETESGDGDISNNHGNSDMFVCRLDEYGNKLWSKTYGGTSSEGGDCCSLTTSGKILIGTNTLSNDDDVHGNHGTNNSDSWVIELTLAGDTVWTKCYGGSGVEGVFKIIPMPNGDFFQVGSAASIDNDLTGIVNYGASYIWVLRCDSIGNIIWQSRYGGNNYDDPRDAFITSDSELCILGISSSTNGLVTNHHIFGTGFDDYWLFKLHLNGPFDWGICLGGSNDDKGCSVYEGDNGNYYTVGFSNSIDYDVSNNHGNNDIWIVDVIQNTNSILPINSSAYQIALTSKKDNLVISYSGLEPGFYSMRISSLIGNVIIEDKFDFQSEGWQEIPLPELSNGVYFLSLSNSNCQIRKNFFNERY
ncbi:MAG: hypothetical protein IPP51_15555 [Bacteroidetes bacterium]|nr:hypothetical protein [Bacteroidota bacterium]